MEDTALLIRVGAVECLCEGTGCEGGRDDANSGFFVAARINKYDDYSYSYVS